MCASTAVFYCNKIYSGKNLFLPAKTIFASPVWFFPPSGKNLPTLSVLLVFAAIAED